MLRRFEATTGMERAVRLTAVLRRGGTQQADALAALSRRLGAEFGSALRDPKLYKRQGDTSDIAQFGAGLRALSAVDAAPIVASVARPLLERAEARGVPRRVRNAVREALGVKH